MSLNLNLDTLFKNEDKSEITKKLIYNLFNDENDTYIFFSLFGLLLYKHLFNKKTNIIFYKKKILKKIKVNKVYNLLNNEIFNIIKNKICINKNNLVFIETHKFINKEEMIYDKYEKKLYKSFKSDRKIWKYNNFLIKEYLIYDFEDNYAIVSIINEIILQIYAYILLKIYKYKKYFIIPKIYNIKINKYDNIDNKIKIKIIMEFLDIKYNINNNLPFSNLKIYKLIKHFFEYLKYNQLYHNDTHRNNLIINNYIILIDFGKSSLYNSFNSSLSGFPKIGKKYLQNHNVCNYINTVMDYYKRKINLKLDCNRGLIFRIY